jgi:predicted ATPase
MITYIKIKGFKSFDDFEMEFTPFTVIAGANASGKSNLFDVFKLLSNLTKDDFLTAFNNQRGEFIELFTKYSTGEYATEMSFVVEMLVDKNITDKWGRFAVLRHTRLRYELKLKRITNELGFDEIILENERLVAIKKLRYKDKFIESIPPKFRKFWQTTTESVKKATFITTTIVDNNITVLIHRDRKRDKTIRRRNFSSDKIRQSILSSISDIEFPHILAVREEIRSWQFLELNPKKLSEPTPKKGGIAMLGLQGENLAGVLYRIKQEDEYNLIEISRKIQKLLPNFISVDVIDDDSKKEYIIQLIDTNKQEYSSRVLSEGTLRLLALCVMEYDARHTGLLCFEEPENGIHPFGIYTILEQLKSLCVDFSDADSPLRQIIINTHSPVLISGLSKYLDDTALSIWYLQMVLRVSKKQKIIISKADKVDTNQKGLALTTIIRYLETVDSEQFKNPKNAIDLP